MMILANTNFSVIFDWLLVPSGFAYTDFGIGFVLFSEIAMSIRYLFYRPITNSQLFVFNYITLSACALRNPITPLAIQVNAN